MVFCYLLIFLSFFIKIEASFFEKSTTKLVRFAARSSASYSNFQTKEYRDFFKRRAITDNIRTFQGVPPVFYSQDQKYFRWGLLAAGISAVAVLSTNQAYAEDNASFNPANVKGRDLTDEELEQCLLEGYKRVEDGYKSLKSKEKKDSVFIIGNTGAGKSVLSLYLKTGKTPVLGNTDTGRKKVSFAGYESLVGDDPDESCTLYPELRFAGGIALWDCPGFKDTRGKNFRLAASVFLDYLTRRGEGGSFLAIVEDDTLDGQKGNFFYAFLQDVSNLLTNSEGELFDATVDRGSLLDSIVWIVTKSSRKPEHIKNLIKKKKDRQRTLGENIAARVSELGVKLLNGGDVQAGIEILQRKNTIDKENLLISSFEKDHTQLSFNSKCREEILSRIRKAKVVSDIKSTFVSSDQREDFIIFAEKIFKRAIEIHQESERLMREQDELTKSLTIKRQLQNIDQVGFLAVVVDEIGNIRNKKQERERRYLEIKRDLDALYQRDKEEVLIWDETRYQRRTRALAGCVNPVFSIFNFDYNNLEKPFLKVVVEKDDFTEQTSCLVDGVAVAAFPIPTIIGWEAFLRSGEIPRHSATYALARLSTKFSATYEGGRGRECRVNVKLYSERSKLPITGVVKELYDKNLIETENEVKKFDKNLRFFEHLQDVVKDKGLREARRLLEESGTDLGSEQRLTTLIEESEKKKCELKKKREVGIALLAMGPGHLHKNPAAEDFKKQFKEEGTI